MPRLSEEERVRIEEVCRQLKQNVIAEYQNKTNEQIRQSNPAIEHFFELAEANPRWGKKRLIAEWQMICRNDEGYREAIFDWAFEHLYAKAVKKVAN